MKESINSNINNPIQLEKMYRENKILFKSEFNKLYPKIEGNNLADFWNERLNYENEEIRWEKGKELLIVIFASLIAGLVAKLPAIFSIPEEFFYPRNIGFIIFPILIAYFSWKNKLGISNIIYISVITLIGVFFINLLPDNKKSDTLILSSIYLTLFLWSILGYSFIGKIKNSIDKRLEFLKYNGDLLVMMALMAIAGAILSAITIGLFSIIGINIEKFYSEYIIVIGASAIPLLSTYLIQNNPQLVSKISPLIAKLFSPIILVMLIIYLIALIYSGKNPLNDRESLMIFNALLIGVMAIIFFSIADSSKVQKSNPEIVILLLMSIVTTIINGIALSAILLRISEWGVTPNRIAILGSNILILINLLLVTTKLYRVIYKKAEIAQVGIVMAKYLPIYVIWTIIITFLFPIIFWFR